MQKDIYLLRGVDTETYQEFSNRIIALGKEAASFPNVVTIKVVYTTGPPPAISIIPFKRKKIAAFSIQHTTGLPVHGMVSAKGFSGGYTAEEAIPVAYEKSWNDLTPTPGICLLTLFRKKKDISYTTFLDRWHNSHTPLSLKIHPLWNYNRNVAKTKLTTDTADWDGIVEEQFKTNADLLNPIKFFGNPLIMLYRMWQVYSDTKSFLDYKTIEPYFATELYIKSNSSQNHLSTFL
jgi:hypothetical protein